MPIKIKFLSPDSTNSIIFAENLENGLVAQRIEQLPSKQSVTGSIPVEITFLLMTNDQ
jgi:hypothetical protein